MLKEYILITIAVILMDIGIYVFKFPNNFSFGGVSGLAVVVTHFVPFTASQINLAINMLLQEFRCENGICDSTVICVVKYYGSGISHACAAHQ